MLREIDTLQRWYLLHISLPRITFSVVYPNLAKRLRLISSVKVSCVPQNDREL
jgi:hypothetical protein